MRLFVGALIISAVLSLAITPSPALANEPCVNMLDGLKEIYEKGKRSKQSAMVQKVLAAIRSADRALEKKDEKACHTTINQIMTKAKKL